MVAATMMSRPEAIGVPQGPRSQRVRELMVRCLSDSCAVRAAWPGLKGPATGTGSEGRRRGRVTGLGDRGDDLVGGGKGGVVIDLDAAGGELHADAANALQTADLLLDLGDAGGAAEALGAEDGVGGGGGGSHDVLSFSIVVLGGSSLDVPSI